MTDTETLNDLYQYNAVTAKWSKIEQKNTPSPRTGSCGIVYLRKFYIFGGRIDNNDLTNEIWSFDFGLRKWEILT